MNNCPYNESTCTYLLHNIYLMNISISALKDLKKADKDKNEMIGKNTNIEG